MKRRDFIQLTGLGLGALSMPVPLFGHSVDSQQLMSPGMEVAQKKQLADVALQAAKSNGATYADIRIGRYLNQYIYTRESKVQNIVNSESFGAGIRVIANGMWGFASTNDVTPDGIAKATKGALAIAKANSRLQKEPVQLVPVKGYGEVSWKTPLKRNAFEVPVSEKVDLLLSANAAAAQNGAQFVNSAFFFG